MSVLLEQASLTSWASETLGGAVAVIVAVTSGMWGTFSGAAFAVVEIVVVIVLAVISRTWGTSSDLEIFSGAAFTLVFIFIVIVLAVISGT
jgi:hypothetical protein